MARLSPTFLQLFDNNGEPLAGGKLYTYEAGTTTPKVTYTSQDESAANTNPIILDSAGRADVWYASGAYKLVLRDTNDVLIDDVDNITGDASNVFGSTVVTLSTNTNITSAYKNNIIVCDTALTLTLLDAASAEEGFIFTVKNTSSGDVVVDPDAAELINGAATFTMKSGTSALIVCDGVGWVTTVSEGIKVSANDATIGLLSAKVVSGAGVNVTALNDGADETLSLSLSDMDEATVRGRAIGSGTGAPEDLTQTQLTALINTATDTLQGAVEKATTAEVLSETVDKYIDAALIKHNKGVAKAHGKIDGTGTPSVTSGHNLGGITDNGTGSYTVNLSITMSDSNYTVVTASDTTGLGGVVASVVSQTTTSFNVQLFTNQSPALVDTTFYVAVYGDLA